MREMWNCFYNIDSLWLVIIANRKIWELACVDMYRIDSFGQYSVLQNFYWNFLNKQTDWENYWKIWIMDMGRGTKERFRKNETNVNQMSVLAHYAEDKDNIKTTDASITGLGLTLWQKQDDGNTKPLAYRSRYLNDTEKKDPIRELELQAVERDSRKSRNSLYGKKNHLYTDHQH